MEGCPWKDGLGLELCDPRLFQRAARSGLWGWRLTRLQKCFLAMVVHFSNSPSPSLPSPISIPIPTRWYGAPGPFLLRIDRSGHSFSWHAFPRRVPSLHQQQHQSPSPSTVDAMVTPTPNRRGHGRHGVLMLSAALLLCCVLFTQPAAASAGDRLPEFKECIKVCPLLPPGLSVSTADVAPLDLRA